MNINLEKLESLLVKNWTEFISYKSLFQLIKEHVSSLINSIPKIIENKNNIVPNRASMSKFYLTKEYCITWFDFQLCLDKDSYVSGTIEFKILPDGNMIISDSECTLHIKQH